MLYRNQENKECLNGWWDIKPVFNKKETKQSESFKDVNVPESGWEQQKYLVPSIWNKPEAGVRKKGDRYYRELKELDINSEEDNLEYLFDAYGYPEQWSETDTAWVRTEFNIKEVNMVERYYIVLEAVAPRAGLYINNCYVTDHNDPSLPLVADVTSYLKEGKNELVLLIKDYQCDDETGEKKKVPAGNIWLQNISGIWQDVYLVRKNEVFISDITIQTSVREENITVEYEITNDTDQEKSVSINSAILKWNKGKRPEEEGQIKALPDQELTIQANSIGSYTITMPWSDVEYWYPENPVLYWLKALLKEGSIEIDRYHERFGFREVWIEGNHLMLNDYPLHLFSDWGHKVTPYHHTAEWIKKWYGMIRDCNMNHSRLHTHPHPELYLDLADEEGILLTGETAIHGSGKGQAADYRLFWDNAVKHVENFVHRDKNHPSLILWSVENEMRWNDDHTSLTEENLPRLRKLFNKLDPTRIAYHEGDSSLWNEREQDIISRHYGKECTGMGWWDQEQPLHSGEMALFHYAGPNNTVQYGGDRVWAEYAEIDRMAALDLEYTVENARTNEVCCLGPWNQSCLVNLRLEKEFVKLDYEDFSQPGIKPLQVPSHSSEFDFWKEGKGYTPQASFYIQKRAFRPFAIIDNSLKSFYYKGNTIYRTLHIINDTTDSIEGKLRVELCKKDLKEDKEDILYQQEFSLELGRGRKKTVDINMVLSEESLTEEMTTGIYRVSFYDDDQIYDKWEKQIRIKTPATVNLNHTLAVFGPGQMKDVLNKLNLDYCYLRDLTVEKLANYNLLLMEKNTVKPGSIQNQILQQFIQDGGRLIVMEQETSLFPGLELKDKPVWQAFVRSYNHDILTGIEEKELFAWGEDPYTLYSGDSYLTNKMYLKDDGSYIEPILDSGEGGFGFGDLNYTPLFEAREGKGLIIACQLRLTDKMDTVPVAHRLFCNLLKRTNNYSYKNSDMNVNDQIEIVKGDEIKEIDFTKIIDRIKQGKTVIFNNINSWLVDQLNNELNINLSLVKEEDGTYQAIRAKDDPVLRGISNEDTCGIETFSYVKPGCANFVVANQVLKRNRNLEGLLLTPEKSCLKELFVYGGRSEPLRAHTLSRFLFEEKPEARVVLGRLKVGTGELYLNMFSPPLAERKRFKRLLNRLYLNLGGNLNVSLLSGDKVPEPPVNSPGYSQTVYFYNDSCDNSTRKKMIECTEYQIERMNPTPILNIEGFNKVKNDDGVWCADDLNLAKDIYIYYTLYSPSVRKDRGSNLGIPDPNALTNLDLYGEGEVELIINTVKVGELSIEDGPATISDIELERGYNHILVKWIPVSKESTLQMKWRDIMRRPEKEFIFMGGGSLF